MKAARRRIACAALTLGVIGVIGPIGTHAAPSTADSLDARVARVTAELRCVVCQNQTIADSHADLAADLRHQVREMLQQGRSEADVLAFMAERYGEFVLYRPPLRAATMLLWFGPALLLVGGMTALLLILRRRSRVGAERFDPDLEDALP